MHTRGVAFRGIGSALLRVNGIKRSFTRSDPVHYEIHIDPRLEMVWMFPYIEEKINLFGKLRKIKMPCGKNTTLREAAINDNSVCQKAGITYTSPSFDDLAGMFRSLQ